MIERYRALGTEQVSGLRSEWADVRTRRYALVFASLALHTSTSPNAAANSPISPASRLASTVDPHADRFRCRHARSRCGVRFLPRPSRAASSITIPPRISFASSPTAPSTMRVCPQDDVHYEMLLSHGFHNRNGGVPQTDAACLRNPARRNTQEKS